MKFLAKSISLMLICVMLISSLASCMNPTVNNTTQDQSEAQSESQTQSDTAEPNTEDPDDAEEATDPGETENLDTEADIDEDETQEDATEEDISDSEEDTNATIPDESEEPDTSATDTPTVTPQDFPKSSFPILQSKKYVIKVTTADSSPSFERLVASDLRNALKTATSVSISTTTDYEKEDKNAYEILIGKTSRTESNAVYSSVPYGAYGIKIVGNKIVFFFSTEAEGSSLVEQFAKKIQSNDKGQFWVSSTLSIVNLSSPKLTGLPKYPADSSKMTTTDTGDNTQMVTVTSTTLEKFNEYCNTLKTNKYVEYSKRDVDGNYFRIYTKDNTAVNAYFSTGRKEARIITGPLKDIPSKDVDKTPETIKPSVTMIGPSESTGNGLGLVYQLANGKFLIIDGGHILSDRIYKELRELQPNGGKLIIAGWFISHPHNDHQDSIENFLTYHANEVEIENIYFNYANADYYNKLTSKDHQGEDQKEGDRVARLRELLAKKLSLKTNIIKPHTGQIYTFGSAKVEIISTVEDFLPTTLTHVNDSSMVVRVTVAGQSTMVLADAAKSMKAIILKMYNSSLDSNMVTMAHHGVWDDTPELYNKIKGEVLFWPSNTASAKEYYGKSSTSEARKAIVAALNNATDVFLAKGTDTKLMLPYKPVGNKDKFMKDTLS